MRKGALISRKSRGKGTRKKTILNTPADFLGGEGSTHLTLLILYKKKKKKRERDLHQKQSARNRGREFRGGMEEKGGTYPNPSGRKKITQLTWRGKHPKMEPFSSSSKKGISSLGRDKEGASFCGGLCSEKSSSRELPSKATVEVR